MPRKPRVLEPNRVYHVYNRRTDRQLLFPSPRAYDEFVDLLETGVQRYGVRICSYCPLETHWHQAIWVRQDDGAAAVSKYLRWLSSCHALRFRFTTQTRGQGHVYQDRYKAHPVHDDRHYVMLVRYIEANPVVAGLVERAEQWPWSSFAERMSGSRRLLVDGPVALPGNWSEIVNASAELELPDLMPPQTADRRRRRTRRRWSGTEVLRFRDGGAALRDGGATIRDGGHYNPAS